MTTLELALLGQPEIKLDGKPFVVASGKAQGMLFYLAVTGRPCSRQKLAGLFWGDMSEERARGNLRVELTKLRPLLDSHLIVGRRTLAFNRNSDSKLDVAVFEERLQRPQPTAQQLQEAVNLYRGDFLEDFSVRDAPLFEEWMLAQHALLRQMAIRALRSLAEYHTQQRQFTAGIACTERLLLLEPWLEEAHRQKMLLLALKGQRNAALAQYHHCRAMLADEMGVEPSTETTKLYQKIQAGEIKAEEEERDEGKVQPVEPMARLVPPFQAPHRLSHFVGRTQELEMLSGWLTRPEQPRICALAGMGGTGKTTLAIHLAHTLRDYFVDGVLWANVATSEPLAILERWAQVYGYDFARLPDLENRAAAFRGILDGKKVLVILDDVTSVSQVQPLLPGSGQCATLLTTRKLALVYAVNAQLLRLGPLDPEDSRQLLAGILGEGRVIAEAEAAREISALLQNLPLAVEITAQRLASRPRRRLADMADRLRNVRNRLNELVISDRAVRTSFEVSWELLDDSLRRVFSRLAVFGGRSFTAEALAYVAELQTEEAEDELSSLLDLSLLAEEGESRYQQHPLLVDFAVEKVDGEPLALARMASYYQNFAQQHQQDYAALRPEWENLMGGMSVAQEQGNWPLVLAYTDSLKGAWFARGRYTEARQGFTWAREAALALGDEEHLAACLLTWAQASLEQNAYDEAEDLLREGGRVYDRQGNEVGVADAQYHLARIALERGRYGEAEELLLAGRAIRERLGDRMGVAATFYQQARVCFRRGVYDEAERLGKEALGIQEEAEDTAGLMRTLRLLTETALTKKDRETAATYCQRILPLCETRQDNVELAAAYYVLGINCRFQGELELASKHAEQSVLLFRQMGDRKSQAHVLYELSLIYEGLEKYDAALEFCSKSLDLLRELRDDLGITNDLLQLGDLLTHLNENEKARQVWQEALAKAKALNHLLLIELLQRRLG
jgi:DNA-binding SARP family transcriptional activator/tetratricopeptide (TPR) repeat protein